MLALEGIEGLDEDKYVESNDKEINQASDEKAVIDTNAFFDDPFKLA